MIRGRCQLARDAALSGVIAGGHEAIVTSWDATTDRIVRVIDQSAVELIIAGRVSQWPIPPIPNHPTSPITSVHLLDHRLLFGIFDSESPSASVSTDDGVLDVQADRGNRPHLPISQDELLFSHILHRQPVMKIKSFIRASSFTASSHDILFLFPSLIVVLDGPSFDELCRLRVESLSPRDTATSIHLQYTKFAVRRQGDLKDVVVYEPVQTITSRFGSREELAAEHSALHIVTVGGPTSHTLCFSSCPHDPASSELVFTAIRLGMEVAKRVASAFFSFGKSMLIREDDMADEAPATAADYPGGEAASADSKIASSAVRVIRPRIIIGDPPQRIIESFSLDPFTGAFAIAADNLGRAMLIDMRQIVVVRLWKGYRDAQAGFIQAPISKGVVIVLYCASRGLLELWPLPPASSRIAAMNVSTHLSLLQRGASCLLHSSRSGDLYRVQLDEDFAQLWAEITTVTKAGGHGRGGSADAAIDAIKAVFKADRNASVKALLALLHPAHSPDFLLRILKQCSTVVEDNRGGEFTRASSLLSACIAFDHAVNLPIRPLSFAELYDCAVDGRVDARLGQSLFEAILMGTKEANKAVLDFIKALGLEKDVLARLFVDWFFSSLCSASSLSVFLLSYPSLPQLDPIAFSAIIASSDIARALLLAQALLSIPTSFAWSPVITKLTALERLRQLLLSSSSFSAALVNTLCIERFEGPCRDYPQPLTVSSVTAQCLLTGANSAEDCLNAIRQPDSVVVRVQREFPSVDVQCVLLDCSVVLYESRNDISGAVAILNAADPSVDRALTAALLFRALYPQFYSRYFPTDASTISERTMEPAHSVTSEHVAPIGHVLQLLSMMSFVHIRSDPQDAIEQGWPPIRVHLPHTLLPSPLTIQNHVVVCRCAQLTRCSHFDLSDLFPEYSIDEEPAASLTSQVKAARRDFLLSQQDSEQAGDNEKLLLARQLGVLDGFLQGHILHRLDTSLIDPQLLEYLHGTHYSASMALLLIDKAKYLLVVVIASLRQATQSRSKSVSTRAEIVLARIPWSAISWLDKDVSNVNLAAQQRRLRTIPVITRFTQDLLTLARAIHSYVSRPTDGVEINRERIDLITRTVESTEIVFAQLDSK